MDEQTFIDKYYKGDRKAYEENMASSDPEADERYFAYGKLPTTRWHDIEAQIKSYPEYEEHALLWIEKCLGYLPQPYAYMPYLSTIQTLVGKSEEGLITNDHFFDEILFQARKVRNNDMKRGGWVLHTAYTERDYRHYDTALALYKELARTRLSQLLGYAPDLDHSLDAEIYLRQFFQHDQCHAGMPFGHMDFKAATVVLYRQAFLLRGEAAADESDLFGLIFKMTQKQDEFGEREIV